MNSYGIILMFMMKKMVLCFVLLLSVTGCSRMSETNKNLAYTSYQGYYEAIEENTRFNSELLYYSLDGEMSSLPDGTYRYYLFLENPQIAMYNVVFLGVENDTPFVEADKMMPSIGIFETQKYNLIPYQANPTKGYVKGLVISGETQNNSVRLKVLIEWSDKSHEKTTREYFICNIDENSFSIDTTNNLNRSN